MKLFTLVATCAALLCAQPPAAFSSLPDDTVIATSDGKPFTAGQLRGLLSSGDQRMNSMAKANPEQFLVNIGIIGYLAQEGEKAHLADQSPLKEQLETMRKQA